MYIPDVWAQLIQDACVSPEPFNVKKIIFVGFLIFKAYSSISYSYKTSWSSICQLRYLKKQPSKLYYKVDFSGDFVEVDCLKPKKCGRPTAVIINKEKRFTKNVCVGLICVTSSLLHLSKIRDLPAFGNLFTREHQVQG